METVFKYSHLTLRPVEARLRHLFWQFRQEDVYQQYKLYTIVFILFSIGSIGNFFFTRDSLTLIDAIYASLLMVLTLLFYMLGAQMKKDRFQNYITALFCFKAIITVVFAVPVLYIETSQTNQTAIIQKKTNDLANALMLVSMFQCSSVAYQIICMLFAAFAVFLLNLLQLAVDDQRQIVKSFMQIPSLMLLSFVIWCILQKRELKSFIRERQAILKQEQLTGLFDSQGDAIVVVQVEPEIRSEQQLDERQDISDQVVFCNKKSTKLFGYDLSEDQSQQQSKVGLLPLSLLEGPRNDQHKAEGFNSLLATEQKMQKLHSLAEILTKSPLTNKLVQESQNEVEMYKMVTVDESQIGQFIASNGVDPNENEAKTIVVNRSLLNFNDKECNVINLTDISAYEDLKKKNQAYSLLKKLNAQVHHEMLVPLRVNVEMADRLLKGKISGIQKRLVKNILVASNMVMLHAHDFLDQSLIEKGVFVPNYTPSSLVKITRFRHALQASRQSC